MVEDILLCESYVGATPTTCLCRKIQTQIQSNKRQYSIWRESCVGATPRACQCCLLKAIDCDSRLSNYQLISQLSATIMMTIMMALLVLSLWIDIEMMLCRTLLPQLILGAVEIVWQSAKLKLNYSSLVNS